MKSNRILAKKAFLGFLVASTTLAAGCGGSQPASTGTGNCTAGSTNAAISTNQMVNGASLGSLSGANVVPLTVGSSLTGGINSPQVNVTVCDTSSHCVTIDNILVDTGSYGLRIFRSLVPSLSLTQAQGESGNPLAECVQYADGSADWGPVFMAEVTLGSESAVTVPVQLIDSAYGEPAVCHGELDTSPDAARVGFNGILGVGLFGEDCGSICSQYTNNGQYFQCSGTSCSGDKASLSNQVTNPVYAETTDNNGVIVELPTVPNSAANSLSGYLVLGIHTETNNNPTGVTTYDADGYGQFDVNCNGQDYPYSYIDSGSNAIFFAGAAGNLPEDSSGWYTPTSALTLDALTTGTGGSPQTYVPLTIANFDQTVGGSNYVYSTVAGDIGVQNTFDMGLPFFFGRNTYVGLYGRSSSIGSGAYWAF